MKRWMSLFTVIVMIISVLPVVYTKTALGQTPAGKLTNLEKKLYEAAKQEGEVVWWDTLGIKEARTVIDEFNGKYPGIKVAYFEGTSDRLEEKYLTEHTAGRHTADHIQIESYDRFKKAGLLAGFRDLVDDTGYPKKFCTEDFDAVSIEHAVYGVAYNAKLIAPQDVPRSWDDLLAPKWKGKINVEPRMFIFIMNTPNWGEGKTIEYLKKLRGQNPTFAKGSTLTLTLLGSGEYPIAVSVLLHGMLREKMKGTPLAWMPLPALVRLSPYIIPRYAPHPNAARLFMRWWMSPEGQLFVDKERNKGNPMPDAGTSQSKVLQQLGITDVFTVKSWAIDLERLRKTYVEAIGFGLKESKGK